MGDSSKVSIISCPGGGLDRRYASGNMPRVHMQEGTLHPSVPVQSTVRIRPASSACCPTHPQLLWQVAQEPGVLLDLADADALQSRTGGDAACTVQQSRTHRTTYKVTAKQ